MKAMIGILKKDNVQGVWLKSNGEYISKKRNGAEKINSQIYLLNESRKNQKKSIPRKKNLFTYVKSLFTDGKKSRKKK